MDAVRVINESNDQVFYRPTVTNLRRIHFSDASTSTPPLIFSRKPHQQHAKVASSSSLLFPAVRLDLEAEKELSDLIAQLEASQSNGGPSSMPTSLASSMSTNADDNRPSLESHQSQDSSLSSDGPLTPGATALRHSGFELSQNEDASMAMNHGRSKSREAGSDEETVGMILTESLKGKGRLAQTPTIAPVSKTLRRTTRLRPKTNLDSQTIFDDVETPNAPIIQTLDETFDLSSTPPRAPPSSWNNLTAPDDPNASRRSSLHLCPPSPMSVAATIDSPDVTLTLSPPSHFPPSHAIPDAASGSGFPFPCESTHSLVPKEPLVQYKPRVRIPTPRIRVPSTLQGMNAGAGDDLIADFELDFDMATYADAREFDSDPASNNVWRKKWLLERFASMKNLREQAKTPTSSVSARTKLRKRPPPLGWNADTREMPRKGSLSGLFEFGMIRRKSADLLRTPTKAEPFPFPDTGSQRKKEGALGSKSLDFSNSSFPWRGHAPTAEPQTPAEVDPLQQLFPTAVSHPGSAEEVDRLPPSRPPSRHFGTISSSSKALARSSSISFLGSRPPSSMGSGSRSTLSSLFSNSKRQSVTADFPIEEDAGPSFVVQRPAKVIPVHRHSQSISFVSPKAVNDEVRRSMELDESVKRTEGMLRFAVYGDQSNTGGSVASRRRQSRIAEPLHGSSSLEARRSTETARSVKYAHVVKESVASLRTRPSMEQTTPNGMVTPPHPFSLPRSRPQSTTPTVTHLKRDSLPYPAATSQRTSLPHIISSSSTTANKRDSLGSNRPMISHPELARRLMDHEEREVDRAKGPIRGGLRRVGRKLSSIFIGGAA